MQTTAVKRVKLLIKRVTNGNLANTCLSAAIFLSGGRPGEIMLWTNHLHLGGKEWFVNWGQAKACVNDGRQESRNKKTTLYRNRHCSKRMLQDLQNLFGYNNKDFSQTLSSVLSAACQREVVKFARVYQSRLLHCLLLQGASFASIRGHSPANSNINMYSGNLVRILVWRLHFLFLWNNRTLGRVMQHNKPLKFGMYFQRFLLTQ